MTPFTIGQHVVCIDNQALDGSGSLRGLQLHTVYSVREVAIGAFQDGEMVGLCLEEIVLPCDDKGEEYLFPSYRFRPLKKLTVDDFCEVREDA